MFIQKELDKIRETIGELKTDNKYFLNILDSLMKMIDYNNQEILRLKKTENDKVGGEKANGRKLREYNIELIRVCEQLKTLKNQ